MLGKSNISSYIYYVINDNNMSKKPLPKHRQLMIESLELLFSGKKSESKKALKKAKSEIEKFYSK